MWHGSEIAVIGLAGRFPGARTVDRLWQLISSGREGITRLDREALKAAGETDTRLADPHYVPAAALLDDVDRFDAAFFGIGPRDAALMDPQHRHLLEVAWSALEHAGYDPARVPGPVGVFAGSGMSAYLPLNLLTNPNLMEELGLFHVRHAGNDKDFLTTRISHLLDLKGPSLGVQTACSTSLVAVHLACQSLNAHECDLALAGGVTIELPHGRGYVHRAGEILAADGHCRPFDARADGTVFGSGAAMVVLRRLEDAVRDGDTIHAVVLGSAVNNDGAAKVGYLAPSQDGQAAAVQEALAVAGVDADSIGYVAAHGTGTRIGDPIEVRALAAAFAPSTGRRGFCALGSIKGNIGHLDTAAGVASLIAAVQALRHREIPPTLHFEAANPLLDLGATPFYVNASPVAWHAEGPRRAGVNSLGVGGTNAHVVLQEAPDAVPGSPSRPWQLLTWSARTAAAADQVTEALAAAVDAPSALPDIAYTLARGRRPFEARRAAVVATPEDARRVLGGREPARLATGDAGPTAPGLAFLFPGGGAQYPGMARDLYRREPVFREVYTRCAGELAALGVDGLLAVVDPGDADPAALAEVLESRATLALPAIFSVEYALAATLAAWGLRPAACLGHSLGEYVAACLAGVWSLEDALAIVATRGRLFDRLPPSAMLSVNAAEDAVRDLIGPRLSLAAVNAAAHVVLSGSHDAVEDAERRLARAGVEHRRLPIRVAAHSHELDAMLDAFRAAVARVPLRPPAVPYVSNVTGTWVTAAEATSADYWVRHLRGTVRFADGLATLLAEPRAIVEVGPGVQLAALARQHPDAARARTIVSTLRHARAEDDDQRTVLDAVGRLWAVGAPVDWPAFFAQETRRRVPLPTYPFARDRHWIEPGQPHAAPGGDTVALPRDLEAWLGRLSWRVAPAPAAVAPAPAAWLVLAPRSPVGDALVRAFREGGGRTVVARPGGAFAPRASGEFLVRPAVPEDYTTLLEELAPGPAGSFGVVHAWALEEPPPGSPLTRHAQGEVLGFDAGVRVLQAVQAMGLSLQCRVWFVGAGFESVAGEPVRRPDAAMLHGLARVAPAEFAVAAAGVVDLGAHADENVPRLVAECRGGHPAPCVAFRGDLRLERVVEHGGVGGSGDTAVLRDGGCYLLTGATGGLGVVCAQMLAERHRARLVLVSRHGATADLVRGLEARGAEVLDITADVGHRRAVEAAVREARARFGHIDGVFHAAGVLDPSLLARLDDASAAAGLAAKTRGTLLLEEALADDPPELVVVVSSISALLGIPGQSTYAAASAYLNAWAQAAAPAGQRRRAIAFGPWRERGMTAGGTGVSPAPEGHPLLGAVTLGTRSVVGTATYRTDRLWVLGEHRVRGQRFGVLPGAASFEIIAAAVACLEGRARGCTIEDLAFVRPLVVPDGESLAVRVSLDEAGDGGRYRLSSRATGAWQEHVTARVRTMAPAPASWPGLAALAARCAGDRGLDTSAPLRAQAALLDLGPRWSGGVRVTYGLDEALATVEAAAAAAADGAYAWHPALIDVAMTAALPLAGDFQGEGTVWVPASCDRAVLRRPPSDGRVIAHARLRREDCAPGVAVFDVWLRDADDGALAELTALRLRAVAVTRLTDVAGEWRAGRGDVVSRLAAEHGIDEVLGARAFERALAAPEPVVIVSPLDVHQLERRLSAAGDAPAVPRAQRPASAAAFVAPADPLEQRLAAIWARHLGIDRVGADDDFFALGGESLVALRIFADIRRTMDVALPVDTLFAAPTVAALARRLGVAAAPSPAPLAPATERRREPSLVPVQPHGARQPLFCVHDQNGYVLLYRDLARHLGPDQPIYGLQAAGLDRPDTADVSIGAMARRYVAAVRAHQPRGPYFLAGSSLGGLVAYEMARQLRHDGEAVALLALFDTWTPANLVAWQRRARGGLVKRARRHAARLVGGGPREYAEWLRENRARRRTQQALDAAVARHLAEGTTMAPQELSHHLDRLFSTAYRAYAVAPYDGTVTLFRARERERPEDDHPTLGWSEVALGGLEVHAVAGHHGFLVREPHVAALARSLRECLDRAASEARNPVSAAS